MSVRAPLYLAGVPEQTGTKAWKQWHLRNTTSFIGESYFFHLLRFLIEKIREIEVLNEFLNVRGYLYLARVLDQTGTKLKVRLKQNQFSKLSTEKLMI